MSQVTTLEHVKAELDDLDAEALQSIREIIARSKRKSVAALKPVIDAPQNRPHQVTATSEPLQFIGENWTLEEFERLSLKERAMLQWRLQQQNHDWLQKKFAEIGAAWLVVVDGKVVASGKTLKTEPMPPQLLEICRRTGRFPFLFVNDAFLTIEESVSAWHLTNDPDDYYPTLPIT